MCESSLVIQAMPPASMMTLAGVRRRGGSVAPGGRVRGGKTSAVASGIGESGTIGEDEPEVHEPHHYQHEDGQHEGELQRPLASLVPWLLRSEPPQRPEAGGVHPRAPRIESVAPCARNIMPVAPSPIVTIAVTSSRNSPIALRIVRTRRSERSRLASWSVGK